MRGHEAILRQFAADDLHYMFGNPGTVEQGFLDALSAVPHVRYILTLQESIAVLCADGYARARFKPALVQIHSSPGLGNAIGNIYQAMRGNSPLVVIGGDAGIRYQAMEAQMAADLVAMAEPVTKWSAMVQHPSSLLRMLRRAIKVAATPPCGPVYLCVPQDILDAEISEEIYPTHIPRLAGHASPETIASISTSLRQARNPIILIGDGVAWNGASAAVQELAEFCGARVYLGDGGEINFPEDHPLYFGSTGHMFGDNSLKITRDCDFCLVIGCYLLPEVFPHIGDIFSPGSTIVHLDENPANIAKNHRTDISVLGNLKALVGQLVAELRQATAESTTHFPAQRQANERRKSDLPDTIPTLYGLDPAVSDEAYDNKTRFMASGYFFERLAALLPSNAMLFDEALTNSPPISRYMPGRATGDKLWTRGGSLGVGVPGAIGMKLAHPDREVIGITGDGGCMYTVQALWTAARHNVAAKFIVCQNRSYRLLQANIKQFWQEQGIESHEYPLCFDLSEPEISFEDLAKGMGVEGERVWKPSQVEPAIRRMLESARPYLINLVLEGDVHPELIGIHCGQ
jgi:benzoylformate decarboxylase